MVKIKIGEIKRQALMLIFPELELQLDEENEKSLCDLLNNLRCDPSIKSYLDSMPPAINRALGKIEGCGATKTKIVEISEDSLEYQNGGYRLNLESLDNALYVKEIYKNGKSISFDTLERDAILINEKGNLKVYYKPRLARISNKTDESQELNLPRDVAEIIPYYIKSELVYEDDKESSKDSLNEFNSRLLSLADKWEYGQIKSVYKLGL